MCFSENVLVYECVQIGVCVRSAGFSLMILQSDCVIDKVLLILNTVTDTVTEGRTAIYYCNHLVYI